MSLLFYIVLAPVISLFVFVLLRKYSCEPDPYDQYTNQALKMGKKAGDQAP